VKELQTHLTEDEAIEAYIQQKEGRYTSEQVQQIITRFIIPLFTAKEQKHSSLQKQHVRA
jgi:hypothetical protein